MPRQNKQNAVSVSYAAVELEKVRRIFRKTVLLVGAENGGVDRKHFHEAGRTG